MVIPGVSEDTIFTRSLQAKQRENLPQLFTLSAVVFFRFCLLRQMRFSHDYTIELGAKKLP